MVVASYFLFDAFDGRDEIMAATTEFINPALRKLLELTYTEFLQLYFIAPQTTYEPLQEMLTLLFVQGHNTRGENDYSTRAYMRSCLNTMGRTYNSLLSNEGASDNKRRPQNLKLESFSKYLRFDMEAYFPHCVLERTLQRITQFLCTYIPSCSQLLNKKSPGITSKKHEYYISSFAHLHKRLFSIFRSSSVVFGTTLYAILHITCSDIVRQRFNSTRRGGTHSLSIAGDNHMETTAITRTVPIVVFSFFAVPFIATESQLSAITTDGQSSVHIAVRKRDVCAIVGDIYPQHAHVTLDNAGYLPVEYAAVELLKLPNNNDLLAIFLQLANKLQMLPVYETRQPLPMTTLQAPIACELIRQLFATYKIPSPDDVVQKLSGKTLLTDGLGGLLQNSNHHRQQCGEDGEASSSRRITQILSELESTYLHVESDCVKGYMKVHSTLTGMLTASQYQTLCTLKRLMQFLGNRFILDRLVQARFSLYAYTMSTTQEDNLLTPLRSSLPSTTYCYLYCIYFERAATFLNNDMNRVLKSAIAECVDIAYKLQYALVDELPVTESTIAVPPSDQQQRVQNNSNNNFNDSNKTTSYFARQ